MKKILAIMLLCLMAAGVYAADKKKPAITFKETTHDFGVIKGFTDWVEHEFEFTNSGDAPLAIATVTANCGCTKPEFPAKPIAPGKSGKIKIRFTPKGIKGDFTRTAKVYTNIKGKDKTVILTISGNVIPK
ncbi:MAG: DUF1573 domain-containing protein [Muribaculaceae bacterium]|nr:DUF1573 domain-containing protein [Muribaculaceae bacterium]